MTTAFHPDRIEHSTRKNSLLEVLEPEVVRAIERDGESVFLDKDKEVLRAGEAFEFVYFPFTCLLSKVAVVADGRAVEVGVIGRDGFAGVPAILGIQAADATVAVQIPGTAFRISTKALSAHLHDSKLQAALGRYVFRSIAETAQALACIAFHPATQRLANWLLRVHDVLGSVELPVTQDALGTMLGIYRPTVTVAAGELRAAGLISYRYGKLTIVDRAGLEKAACECFASRLLTMPPRPSQWLSI